jgi:hypothetical protein
MLFKAQSFASVFNFEREKSIIAVPSLAGYMAFVRYIPGTGSAMWRSHPTQLPTLGIP